MLFYVNASYSVCVFYVNASYSVCVFYVNASRSVCVFYVNASRSLCVFYVNASYSVCVFHLNAHNYKLNCITYTMVKLWSFFPHDIQKMTSIYKYGYLGCNYSFPMTITSKMTSIHKKDTHKMTSSDIKGNLVAFIQIIKFPNFNKPIYLHWFFF
jgi:hypothetical protein